MLTIVPMFKMEFIVHKYEIHNRAIYPGTSRSTMKYKCLSKSLFFYMHPTNKLRLRWYPEPNTRYPTYGMKVTMPATATERSLAVQAHNASTRRG